MATQNTRGELLIAGIGLTRSFVPTQVLDDMKRFSRPRKGQGRRYHDGLRPVRDRALELSPDHAITALVFEDTKAARDEAAYRVEIFLDAGGVLTRKPLDPQAGR